MADIKNLLGYIATLLVFVSYIPYIRDVLSGKTKPHPYTWFLWSFITLIAFGLQFVGGAGSGSLVTLAAAIMCVVVLILTLLQKNKIEIVKKDIIFFIFAFIALGLWLIAKQPIISAILITATDFVAFFPTIRKSWNKPYSETVLFYLLETFRFGLAIIALQKYSIVTTLYPACWLTTEFLFALMLIYRRRQVSSHS
ncbi:MAG: hypothetical protein WCJ58_04060 [bacterium]